MVQHEGRDGDNVRCRLFCWRTLRWLGVAPLLPLLWACADRNSGQPPPNHASSEPKLDILFMVDNSRSMSFGKNGLMQSICADDFRASLSSIDDALRVRLQPAYL